MDIWGRTFDAIQDIVTLQNKDLEIVKANKAAHAFFAVQDGDLSGKHCYEVFSGKSGPCPNCPLLVTIRNGSEHVAIIKHEKLNRTFRVSSSVIPATGGGEEHLLHVARDITRDIESERILRESEERFSKAFHANPAPMVISAIASGRFIDVNQRWIELIGYSRKELIGTTSRAVGIWEDPSERGQLIKKLSAEGFVREYPLTFRTKAGESRLVLWSAEVISINGRDLMLSLINDVTEREKAERILRESEEKFALAFKASPDAININRLSDGLFVDVNSGFVALTGFTWEDVQGKTGFEINIWYDLADREKLVEELRQKGYCENLEAKFCRKDGSITTALMSARIITLQNIPHILSITRDISKLRQVEQEVSEKKMLFEAMFNAIDDGVVITDVNRAILLANKGMEKNFGYSPLELIGKPTSILYADQEEYQALGKNYFSQESEQRDRLYVTAYKNKSGEEFPGETFGVKLYDLNQRWIGNLGIMRDISQRQKDEAERNRMIAAIEQTSDAIVITDYMGNIQYVNPAFTSITGYFQNEVIGQNPRFLKSGEQDEKFYQHLWQTLSKGQNFTGRMVNRRKGGSLFTEEATISPICARDGQIINYVAVKRDITEQILLEAQFQQAQKMEAVGRLTGGVAHDINNTLGIIIGYTEMILEDMHSTDQLRGDLGNVLEAAHRSTDIVRQLLAFSRQQTISPKVLDLNKAVVGMLKIIRPLIGEDIDLAWVPGQDVHLIKMDPAQIDQILVNLCVNAKDAISGVGRITIETAMVTIDEEYCANHKGFVIGNFVQLAVSDNGCGIDRETQKKIFEPFFSTKELGRGTGLGLATVYGIVKQNNGFIDVYSDLGSGTVFKVYFPACLNEALSERKAFTTKPKERQGETVLVVEDNPSLLKMTRKMLELHGYTVLTASAPMEALKIAADRSNDIHLLLTDVVLPEMTGKDLANKIQSRHPMMQVLFMSGYTANVIAHDGILEDGVQFIQKPFTVNELIEKIETVLDAV